MASNYGVKVIQDGKTLDLELTNDNIQFLNFFSRDSTLMIVKTALVSGGTYTHNLGYKPFFIAFSVDSTTTPTQYIRNLLVVGATANTTQITGLPTNAYVILFTKNY